MAAKVEDKQIKELLNRKNSCLFGCFLRNRN